ncbi:MAG TPA: tripartite tricarboxylate transporter TctB family protein [bacterium]|nr:tripartite tricarboxylate transporter TctB family protein [bacterium]
MHSDRPAAIVLATVAALYIWEAREFRGVTVSDVVGPSAYPWLLGGTLALLAIVLFARTPPSTAGGGFWSRHGRPAAFTGSLFAYCMALEPVGFLASTFVYLAFSHRWLGEQRWVRAILIAAGATVALWVFFDRVLDVGLPAGAIGWPR